LKENEILREKVDMLNILASYEGKYFSSKYIRKHILRQSDEMMRQIDAEISSEQALAAQAQAQQQMMQGPPQQEEEPKK
jgi:23S rRNA maturation mini-RNase III